MLLGSAHGKIEIDASGVRTGVNSAVSSLSDLQKKAYQIGDDLKKLGRNMTLAISIPLVAMGASSIKAASSLEEARNKVKVVFGEMGESMLEWSKTSAEVFGQSQRQALEAAGTFGNFFTAMGIGKDKSAEMSKALTILASDLASFNDIDPAEALLKLQAGLAGETEPLRRLGVDLTMVRVKAKAMEMGLADANGELSQQALILARYAVIMEQTKAAQGDYQRTQDSLANSTRELKAKYEDMLATFGEKLLPVAVQVVDQLSKLVDWFTKLSPKTQENIIKFAGLLIVLGPLINIIGNLVNFITTMAPLLSNLGTVLPGIVTAFTSLGTVITGTVIPAIGAFLVAAGPIIIAVALVAGAIGLLYWAFKTNFGGIRTTAEQLWFILKWGFKQMWTTITDGSKVAFGNLREAWHTALESLRERFAGFSEWLRGAWQNVLTFFGQIRNRIFEIFRIDWSVIGRMIIQGIITGLLGGNAVLANAVMNIAKTIYNTLKNSLAIRSPSAKAAWLGKMTSEGYLEGMAAALNSRRIAEMLSKPVSYVTGGAQLSVTQNFNTGLSIREARRVVAENNEQMLSGLEAALG